MFNKRFHGMWHTYPILIFYWNLKSGLSLSLIFSILFAGNAICWFIIVSKEWDSSIKVVSYSLLSTSCCKINYVSAYTTPSATQSIDPCKECFCTPDVYINVSKNGEWRHIRGRLARKDSAINLVSKEVFHSLGFIKPPNIPWFKNWLFLSQCCRQCLFLICPSILHLSIV